MSVAIRWRLATFIAASVGIGWLALSLPAEGFFSGDSGLKLIAAKNAIAHPARPFEIDLPRIGEQLTSYVDPGVVVHGDHGHALQSPLFPVITAPWIDTVGLRGAYIIPAISFIALLPLVNLIRRQAAPETSFAILAWLAVAANPMLFYSLEFWEHAPAVAVLAGATASALLAGSRSSELAWPLTSGVLGGISMLLRPEAIWYVAGLGLIIGCRRWFALGCGAAIVLVPFTVANYVHSGNVLGSHASANLAPLLDGWLDGRWQRVQAWFWPDSSVAMVGLLLVAGAWVAGLFSVDLRTRQTIGLVGAALVSILATQGLLPRESLWQAFPVLLLAMVPSARSDISDRLYVVAGISGLGVVLTATVDGGAQWGPRFLLIATPALLVLTARAAADAIGTDGKQRALRTALVVIVLVAGLATSRLAYRELRNAKHSYGRVVAAAASLTSPGDVLVTNVSWFDQIAAPLYGSRVFLYGPDLPTITRILNELSYAGTSQVALIWTDEPEGEALDRALDATCFEIVSLEEESVRSLRIATARCDAGEARSGFDGTRALEGLAPPEGPYPEWGLPRVRWGLGPVTRFEVDVPPPGGGRLLLDARADFAGQTMRLSVGGRRLAAVEFVATGTFERFEISLDLEPGKHEIEISHSHWHEPSETDDRPLAVLFRTILLLPPQEGAGR